MDGGGGGSRLVIPPSPTLVGLVPHGTTRHIDTCYDDILHDIKVVSHECCIMSCQMSYEIFMTCHIISHVTCHGTGTSLNMEHLCYHAMS